MAETITVQMERIMDEYTKRVKNAYEVATDRVSREAVRKLRNTSPKKTGSYARGWKLKRLKTHDGVTDVIVHNATDYQLTHLLENGHVVRNAKGEYGRAPAHKHIAPVAEWANNELPTEIERELL